MFTQIKIFDKYIISEMLKSFFSSFMILTSLIFVSQLMRLAEMFLSFGFSIENIFLPFLYVMVPFLPNIISITMILSTISMMSRMSLDGELGAYFAFGQSFRRLFAPLFLVTGLVYVVTFYISVELESWGNREFLAFVERKTQTQLDVMIHYKLQSGVFIHDFLGHVLYADHISQDGQKLTQVLLAPEENNSKSFFRIFAKKAEILGSVRKGDLKMIFFDGVAIDTKDSHTNKVLQFQKLDIDLLTMFKNQIFGSESSSIAVQRKTFWELFQFLKSTDSSQEEARRGLYVFIFRLFNPFSVFAFFLLGIVCGLTNPRSGVTYGYALSLFFIVINFSCVLSGKLLSLNNIIHPVLGAVYPVVILTALSLWLFYRRMKTPLGESLF